MMINVLSNGTGVAIMVLISRELHEAERRAVNQRIWQGTNFVSSG